MSLKLYTYPDNPRAAKALIAAKYVGVSIEVPVFNFGVDNKTPEFLKKNPSGKVPVLETPEGSIFESNAIARYVARLGSANLYGSNNYEAGLVDQWIDFTAGEIDLPAAAWLYPIMGFVENNEVATAKAKADIRKVLHILDSHLQTRTFLVGERITLADIVVAASLLRLYTLVLDPAFRKAYVNTNRWFLTCVNQPNFKNVLSEVKLAEKMAVAAAAPAAASEEKPKEAPKKEPAPKKEAPKKKEKEADEEEEESFEDKKPKGPNPLDLLPPTNFVLDNWKRVYSNEKDTRGVAMKWFWENFDAAGWSLYLSNFKYNSDLDGDALFKINNRVGGFIQRLDKLRKYGFGSVLIFGKDDKNQIGGAWLFRGPGIPAEMTECEDSELFEWTKVDPADEKQKTLVEDFWCWAGDFGGQYLPFLDQGKVFK